ncbi:hypothetical protein [Flavobacterium sp. NRK1]|uniref:immunoglobulin domain-containing protein n=1 Tax=Flavobacterium sp. NRK1 TaxID=2954929 RepID=UPI0020939554|nr:hypothetical protein [Flavobacterium sp. NRK1]MCO6148376.1 hypothetical protein [Flavobacterium sp. NRK1]
MFRGAKIQLGELLHTCCAVFFLLFICNLNAQTKVYATSLVNASTNTDNEGNAVDQNLTTAADVRAYSGVVVFGGAYVGTLDFQFPSTLTANTTSYVKIQADQANLLSGLLGGSLASLLTTILGSQEFTVEVKNSAGTNVLSGNSQTNGDFGTSKLGIVVNAAGEYFIKITPDQDYKRIKITNRYATLLGTGVTKKLKVYDAYYLTGTATCGEPTYTSYNATSVVSLASTGVTNPQNVLTASTSDFSKFDIGLLGVGPSIEQTVYFEGLSSATDSFGVRLSLPQGLLDVGVASNISVIASNGATVVQTKTLAELLTLNLLTMSGGQITNIIMTPGAPVDRITVKLSAVASVAQTLNFYGVTKTLAKPVITQNNPVCSGSSASLIATTPIVGAQLKWYDSAAATNLLATTNSGETFTPPAITANTTYYVLQTLGGCSGFIQSVPVTVVSKPSAGVIEGVQTVCYNKTPSLLTSVSADNGVGISYRWESSLDEVTWSPIASSNAVTYQPSGLTKSTFFRRITINTANGIDCESIPTNTIKVSAKNCMVIANPMVAQRIKNGS